MAEPSRETQEKIQQLQLLEQNLNNFSMQRQSFQLQLQEIDSALKEIENVDTAYRILGGIMINSPKEAIKKELDESKEAMEVRLKSIDAQEKRLRDKATSLKAEVLEAIEGK